MSLLSCSCKTQLLFFRCAGCSEAGDPQWRVLLAVERFHTVLRTSRAAHCLDLHLPGADEQGIQSIHPQGHVCFWGVVTVGWWNFRFHLKKNVFGSKCVFFPVTVSTFFLLHRSTHNFYLFSYPHFIILFPIIKNCVQLTEFVWSGSNALSCQ